MVRKRAKLRNRSWFEHVLSKLSLSKSSGIRNNSPSFNLIENKNKREAFTLSENSFRKNGFH